MEINRERMKKGDDVRVKYASLDGYVWHSATVLRDDEDGLSVEFASGMRYRVPHGQGRYERVTEA